MTKEKHHASDFIGVSVFNPVHVKSRQPSGCQWEAEGTSLSVFDPERGFAVPSHESAGTTWLSDGSLLSLAKALEKQLAKKKVFQFVIFTTSFFN